MDGLLNQTPIQGLLPDERGLLGPMFGNPALKRQFAKQREFMAPPTSVTDPRWEEHAKRQRQADHFLIGADLLTAAAPFAKPGLLGAAKMLGPVTENYMARSGLLSPVTAWHGSPHNFNAFDMSKVGTGEGAAAYGHGLYFAENPKVATQYAKELGGKTYKVDIPDEAVGKMMDWNRPLSQQPENVRSSLETLYRDYLVKNGTPKQMVDFHAARATGEDIYSALVRNRGRAAASKMLKDAGIPGIRYLDQGSRGASGTHNFVVFDDKLPKIIGRE